MRDCGDCREFGKLKNGKHSGGMCHHLDGLRNTDDKCEDWKGIKYDRKLVNPVPSPRYDDVYEEGMKWLNSL